MLVFFVTPTPCVVGMEACGGSHFWAREIALFGHTVRLMGAVNLPATQMPGPMVAGCGKAWRQAPLPATPAIAIPSIIAAALWLHIRLALS